MLHFIKETADKKQIPHLCMEEKKYLTDTTELEKMVNPLKLIAVLV